MQKDTIVWLGLLFGILMIFGCVNDETTKNSSTFNGSNPNLSPNLSTQSDIVHIGDRVSAYYSLFVDGTLVDTNIRSLVNSTNSTQITHFDPLIFSVQLDGSMIPGFVKNVVGMKINQTKNFTVSPSEGYGLYNPNNVMRVDRYYERNLFETVKRSDLVAAGVTNITKGRQIPVRQGTVFINSTDGENVVLYYVFLPGMKFEIDGVPQIVNSLVDNNIVRIEYDFVLNQTYHIPDPRTGNLNSFLVTNKTNDSITLDGNHFLANKSLDFQVTVLNITRGR